MINIYYNPYCGQINDFDLGIDCLLGTANSLFGLFESYDLLAHDSPGYDSISNVILTRDSNNIQYTAASLIRFCAGRNRELARWFCRTFDRGHKVNEQELANYQNWMLVGLDDTYVSVLECAAKNDSMSVTVSNDAFWCSDFFSFQDIEKQSIPDASLPNIHGQDDLSPIYDWINGWEQRNHNFIEQLESRFNATICAGATNFCFPNDSEQINVIDAFAQAQQLEYNISGPLKIFTSRYGSIFELRSFGDGFRVFFALDEGNPVIGGFYKKSVAIDQNKAGNNAAKRLKDAGYI